ncbi:MAG TPA: hypothetical protein VHA54_02965 [Solirubrobacterales bacterium]|nr:hypothetical protein [Solirubrobacterales bacterium]
MRTKLATLVVALTAVAVLAPAAQAAPTEVNVRIEGKTETLFEGPILTDGHNVRATSDGKAPPAGRRCNGLNANAHPTAGPTPTAAAVDAMAIRGQGFDGDWYAEPFEDYFITQWGPDRQDVGAAEYWGLAVNNVFTSVGGCQFQDREGDEVLWVYDAFGARPRLLLYPGDYGGGPVRLTAEAQLGVPFAVEVDSWNGHGEGAPPATPQRSTEPFAGAEVAPVVESAKGFEEVDVGSPATVTTAADGSAEVTFDAPGWHRLKATEVVAGRETVIRSNRLDVCVATTPGAGCGPPPADDLVRTPPAIELPGGEGPGGGPGTDPGPGPTGPGTSTQPQAPSPASGAHARGASGAATAPGASPVRVALRGLDRSRLAAGLVGVSWRLRDPGPGLARWRISSQLVGERRARFVTRASGRAGTSATVRLPKGAVYRLRIVFTDTLGRSSTASLGRVRVPG